MLRSRDAPVILGRFFIVNEIELVADYYNVSGKLFSIDWKSTCRLHIRSIIIIDAILFEKGSAKDEIAICRRIFSEERNC